MFGGYLLETSHERLRLMRALFLLLAITLLLPLTAAAQSGDIRLTWPDTSLYRIPNDIRIQSGDISGGRVLVVWGTTIPHGDTVRNALVWQFADGAKLIGSPALLTDSTFDPYGLVRVISAGSAFHVLWQDRRYGPTNIWVATIDTGGKVLQRRPLLQGTIPDSGLHAFRQGRIGHLLWNVVGGRTAVLRFNGPELAYEEKDFPATTLLRLPQFKDSLYMLISGANGYTVTHDGTFRQISDSIFQHSMLIDSDGSVTIGTTEGLIWFPSLYSATAGELTRVRDMPEDPVIVRDSGRVGVLRLSYNTPPIEGVSGSFLIWAHLRFVQGDSLSEEVKRLAHWADVGEFVREGRTVWIRNMYQTTSMTTGGARAVVVEYDRLSRLSGEWKYDQAQVRYYCPIAPQSPPDAKLALVRDTSSTVSAVYRGVSYGTYQWFVVPAATVGRPRYHAQPQIVTLGDTIYWSAIAAAVANLPEQVRAYRFESELRSLSLVSLVMPRPIVLPPGGGDYGPFTSSATVLTRMTSGSRTFQPISWGSAYGSATSLRHGGGWVRANHAMYGVVLAPWHDTIAGRIAVRVEGSSVSSKFEITGVWNAASADLSATIFGYGYYHPNYGNRDTLIVLNDTGAVVRWKLPQRRWSSATVVPLDTGRMILVERDSLTLLRSDGSSTITPLQRSEPGWTYRPLLEGAILRYRRDSLVTSRYLLQRVSLDGITRDSVVVSFDTALQGLRIVQRNSDSTIWMIGVSHGVRAAVLDRRLRPIVVDTLISQTTGLVRNPAAAFLRDTLLVAWEDPRNGSSDIYMSRTFVEPSPATSDVRPLHPERGVDALRQTDPSSASGPTELETIEWMRVLPNPCRGDLVLRFRAPRGRYHLEIVDAMGRLQATTYYHVDDRRTEQSVLDLSRLEPGAYMVRLSGSRNAVSEKVVVLPR